VLLPLRAAPLALALALFCTAQTDREKNFMSPFECFRKEFSLCCSVIFNGHEMAETSLSHLLFFSLISLFLFLCAHKNPLFRLNHVDSFVVFFAAAAQGRTSFVFLLFLNHARSSSRLVSIVFALLAGLELRVFLPKILSAPKK
jgi:hypothetical protein